MLYIRLHGLQLCENQQKTCASQRPYSPRSRNDREIVRPKWKESGFGIYCCYVLLEPRLNRLHQSTTTIHYTKRIVRSRYLPGLGIPLDGSRFQPSSKQHHKVSGCFIQRTRTGRMYQYLIDSKIGVVMLGPAVPASSFSSTALSQLAWWISLSGRTRYPGNCIWH